MLKETLRYLNENPHNYWFKAKCYGWGWVPVKWQGWAVTLGYVAFFATGEYLFISLVKSGSVQLVHGIIFLSYIIILTVILIRICYKTGEKPRWQWNPPKK